MLSRNLNFLFEKVLIAFVCFWGSWAFYYWVMVLVFDASLNTLTLFSPILIAQICFFLFVFLRSDFRFTDTQFAIEPTTGRAASRLNARFYCLCLVATTLAIGIISVINYYHLSNSLLHYNLLWAFLLPLALYYVFFLRPTAKNVIVVPAGKECEPPVFDVIAFVICTTILAFNLYGTIPPTADDGFYVGVVSSTLASPDLPIQARDFLHGTSAPFTLHPAYRTAGYEVLIAFVSHVTGIDPLHLFYGVLPIFNLILWAVAAYVFMRSLGTPYPGISICIVFITQLFWNGPFTPGFFLAYLCWGKHLLLLVAVPLLYLAVALFMGRQRFRTWLFLLMAVSSAGIWSTSAQFFVPMCIAISFLLYLPTVTARVRTVVYLSLSLIPILLLTIYTLVILSDAPIGTVDDVFMTNNNEWFHKQLQESLFGGLEMQSLLLVLLFLLPLITRTADNTKFQINVHRICLIGVFTVMAPYVLEAFATVTNTQILLDRFYFTFPFALLVGIPGGVALAQILPYEKLTYTARFRRLVIAATILFYALLFGLMPKMYIFGEGSKAIRELSMSQVEEARAIRGMIPDGSFVASGVVDYFLPMLPNPPTFVSVRMTYLDSHRQYLPADEYRARQELATVLSNSLPRNGQSLEDSLEWIVSQSNSLGVSSIVFPAPGAFKATPVNSSSTALNGNKQVFAEALTTRLRVEDYSCTVTPSGKSTVCNKTQGTGFNPPVFSDELDSQLALDGRVYSFSQRP